MHNILQPQSANKHYSLPQVLDTNNLSAQRFSGLEVLYNYLLTLDEDIDFCEGAIVAEWDEFEDILDFQKKTAGDTYPEYPTIKQPASLYPIDEPPAPAKKLKTFSLFF
jgi:hypothetical protein